MQSRLVPRPCSSRRRCVSSKWRPTPGPIATERWAVPTHQPLGRLVFALLEPRAPDGVLNWGFLDDAIDAEPTAYPIRRLRELPAGWERIDSR